jgi:hypothetical protein
MYKEGGLRLQNISEAKLNPPTPFTIGKTIVMKIGGKFVKGTIYSFDQNFLTLVDCFTQPDTGTYWNNTAWESCWKGGSRIKPINYGISQICYWHYAF